MATVDSILTEIEQNLNRAKWFDAGGADITTTYLTGLINKTIHELERFAITPYQTFTYALNLVANQQVYPLQPVGTATAYRGTHGITIPNQTALTANVGMNGWQVQYLLHEQARTKYQLIPSNMVLPGPPYNYSIFGLPQQLAAPSGFTLTGHTTGGTIPAGTYLYTLTAIVNGVETVCATEQSVTLSTNASSVTAAWSAYTGQPLLTGFKLYRGTVSGAENLFYTAASSATSFLDTNAATQLSGSPLVPVNASGSQAAYWVWPTPNQAYFANVDQDVFLADLVTGQSPAATNWFTQFCSDAIVFDATLKAAVSLKDQTAITLFQPLRGQAWEAAVSAVSGLQFGEEYAQSIEPG